MQSVPPSNAAAWLHRRAGFGLSATTIDDESAKSADAVIADLIGTTDSQPDPWAELVAPGEELGRAQAVVAWITRMISTSAPYVDRRTWMLHGWLVSSIDKARSDAMVDQLRLFMTTGGGPYSDLLRAVTVDRAMLTYLDGRTSTADAPNENYGRELLELFALGVGEDVDGSEQPYTEADVKAAAVALTGWTFGPNAPVARFGPGRHDDTPQTLLGVSGVHDVDTVIDAVVSHPEHARFVARRIATEYVGDVHDDRLAGVVDDLAATYDATDRRLDATIETALRIGLDGRSSPIVLGPIPWMTIAARAFDLPAQALPESTRQWIREMGQIPMFPRSVKGWDGGTAWFTASSLIARTNIAAQIVAAAEPDQPLKVAADAGDLDEVARLLGLRDGFGASTTGAINGAPDPDAGLVLALVSPEGLLS